MSDALTGGFTRRPSHRVSTTHMDRQTREFLTSCPRAGGGVHNWIWRAALRLRRWLEPDKARRLLAVAATDCGRDCDRDIDDAVAKCWEQTVDGRTAVTPVGTGRGAGKWRSLPWPTVNDDLRRQIVAGGNCLAGLQRSSPSTVPTDEKEIAPFMVNHLFPGDRLLSVGWDKNRAETRRKSELERLYRYPLIVPNPMSARHGINQQGERSARCLDNTGPRIYLICEFDLPVDLGGPETIDKAFVRTAQLDGTTIKDISAALIGYLGRAMPLVAVVDSGNKSLHGWFNVEDCVEADIRRFMRLAVRIGADPHTYVRCQFVRMPGGVRLADDSSSATCQEVHYFDAAHCAAAPDQS